MTCSPISLEVRDMTLERCYSFDPTVHFMRSRTARWSQEKKLMPALVMRSRSPSGLTAHLGDGRSSCWCFYPCWQRCWRSRTASLSISRNLRPEDLTKAAALALGKPRKVMSSKFWVLSWKTITQNNIQNSQMPSRFGKTICIWACFPWEPCATW